MQSFSDDQSFKQARSRLTLLPLVAIIFYSVSGGPFGVEASVRSGGPLLAILGFAILPIFWSIPKAIIAAELATAFPANGAYAIWIREAFGPFWGFQAAFWRWITGVVDNAVYPVLFLDYLKPAFPGLAAGMARSVAVFAIAAALTLLNYRGLAVVGFAAVCLAAFSLLPFVLMGIMAVPRLDPGRWTSIGPGPIDWKGLLNNLAWNLGGWDSPSAIVGEVEDPTRTLPRALAIALLLVVAAYLGPILAGTGALPVDPSQWVDGYFSTVGFQIGGPWLRIWIQLAAALSNAGLFEAGMSGNSFQLLGMAEMGMLPRFLADRSRYGTPVWGIWLSAMGVAVVSWMSFVEMIEMINFVAGLGMLMELAAFVMLRLRRAEVPRPYRAPVGNVGCVLLCLPPAVLIVGLMSFVSLQVVVLSAGVIIMGMLFYLMLEASAQ